jgi:hypothetical protein
MNRHKPGWDRYWLEGFPLHDALAAIQKIRGHNRLITTAIYLNLTNAYILEEFEAKW